MKEFSQNLKKYREMADLSYGQLEKKTGIPRATLFRYENEPDRKVPIDSVPLLEAALNLLPGTLLGWTSSDLRPLNAPLTAGAVIPVLGKVPAGVPIEAVEDIIDEIEISSTLAKDDYEYFALLVTGNSMYPEYLDGDIVIVRKQEDASTGDDVIAYINGYDATLKRLLKSPKGITLRPINQEYETRSFTNKEIEEIPVRIAGIVVEQRRSRK